MSNPTYKITSLGSIPLTSPVVSDNKLINSSSQEIALPSSAGTLALLSDIPSLANYVTLDGVQSITGVKTFSSAPVISSISNSSATLTVPSTTGTLALVSEVNAQKDRIDRLLGYLESWINAGNLSMSDIRSVVDPVAQQQEPEGEGEGEGQ